MPGFLGCRRQEVGPEDVRRPRRCIGIALSSFPQQPCLRTGACKTSAQFGSLQDKTICRSL